MTPQIILYILLAIIIVKFIFDTFLNALNSKHFKDTLPKELQNIYNKKEYVKSQNYKKTNYRFLLITSTFSVIVTVLFFIFEGFAFVDNIARNFSNNTIIITLLFFGIIIFANDKKKN